MGRVNKYIGHDSSLFSTQTVVNKTDGSKSFAEANDFGKANFAIMIYSKELDGFRIVPVHRHFFFEKQKHLASKQDKPLSSRRQTSVPAVGDQINSSLKKNAPKKSGSNKDRIKNLFRQDRLKNSIIGGTKSGAGRPKGSKKKVNKPTKNSDSDSQIYGGDNANEEFEQQLGQGLFNDDSHEEVAEDIAIDDPTEEENESNFDSEDKFKTKGD